MKSGWLTGIALLVAAATLPARAAATPADYYGLRVVDQASGRGVPNVELVAPAGGGKFYTDSNGWAAINSAGLVNKSLSFNLYSYGYATGSAAVTTTPGARNTVTLARTSSEKAERIYRITGQGIYADSLKLGIGAPIANPLINSNVTGQDSVQSATYKGKLFWTWGDTLSPDPNVFNLRTSGATSALPPPAGGGLPPAQGIDLTYYASNNFVKQMMPINDPGFLWMDALTTVHDSGGAEKLISHYSRMQDLSTRLEHGLAVFDDATETFQRLTPFSNTAPIAPVGHSFQRTEGAQSYLYFTAPYPNVRVKNDWASLNDPSAYETYTPLKANTTYSQTAPQFDRDGSGNLIWGWKKNTTTWTSQMQIDQVNAGRMQRSESPFRLKNADTGADIWLHSASVYWNGFLDKYLMIGEEAFGTSWLGEIYAAAADTPEGPWTTAEKIVTHAAVGDRPEYAFYNVTQDPQFDEQDGRIVYLEGSYTRNLYGDNHAFDTPLYEYNQVMYRLDLSTLSHVPEPATAAGAAMAFAAMLFRGRRRRTR